MRGKEGRGGAGLRESAGGGGMCVMGGVRTGWGRTAGWRCDGGGGGVLEDGQVGRPRAALRTSRVVLDGDEALGCAEVARDEQGGAAGAELEEEARGA
jgi:hypothetical protein